MATLPVEAFARRDVAGVAWWALRGLAEGTVEGRVGSVMASLLRVLLAAGDGGPGGEEALREIELRGLLMHGLPPRDEGEWALLAATFSPEAVDEVRRWQALFEPDALDGVEPGVLFDE